MKRILIFQIFFLAAPFDTALAIAPPTGLVIISGDKSVILHWDPNTDTNLSGYTCIVRFPVAAPLAKKKTTGLRRLDGKAEVCSSDLGDKSVILHWDPNTDTTLSGYTCIVRFPVAARSSKRIPAC